MIYKIPNGVSNEKERSMSSAIIANSKTQKRCKYCRKRWKRGEGND